MDTKQKALLVVPYRTDHDMQDSRVCVNTHHYYNRPLSHKSSCEPVLNVKTQGKAAAGALS